MKLPKINTTIIKEGFNSFSTVVVKNTPTILTGLGVVGTISSVVLAVKATPKAIELIWMEETRREIEEQKHLDELRDELICKHPDAVLSTKPMVANGVELTPFEMAKVAWKCYIPTTLMTVATISCIIGSNTVNLRRQAALVSAYQLADSSLKEYQAKVVDTIGEKKEQKVRDDIAQDHMDKVPIDQPVIFTGDGDVQCYDEYSGRLFESSHEKINRAINNINKQINDGETFVPINDFYKDVGLPEIQMGSDFGWNKFDENISPYFSTTLFNNRPCLVVDFSIGPRAEIFIEDDKYIV